MTKTDLSFETGMLSFARSIQITEGLFYGTGTGENGAFEIPVQVLGKGVRGQSSEDGAKNPGMSNPQSVDSASVPQGCTGVELRFSVRVLPLSLKPHACNNTEVGKAYDLLTSSYKSAGGYKVLAELYVWNIANGRFAWRNRYQTDEAFVTVTFDGVSLKFDPSRLDLVKPATIPEMASALVSGSPEDLEDLIEGFARGLSEEAFAFDVVWSAAMQPGQEIFPSQEYVREDDKKKEISRVYAKQPTFYRGKPIDQASMHSQKIGAAIRHVDIWHGSEEYGAIAVNPYGGVQETSAVLRNPKSKNSFYDLRKKASALLAGVQGVTDASGISADVHFVVANLVRGGVLGSKNNKEANA
jgi:CRISPR type I-F/YPEST-associated protein Csy3